MEAQIGACITVSSPPKKPQDEVGPPFAQAANCPKSFDDGHTWTSNGREWEMKRPQQTALPKPEPATPLPAHPHAFGVQNAHFGALRTPSVALWYCCSRNRWGLPHRLAMSASRSPLGGRLSLPAGRSLLNPLDLPSSHPLSPYSQRRADRST